MATDTEITMEQLEMIEKQAKEKYSVQMDAINLNNQVIEYDYNEPIREVYIAAKTEDAIEIKVLREALEKIAMQHTCKDMLANGIDDFGDIEYGYDKIIDVARTALNYNSKIKQ